MGNESPRDLWCQFGDTMVEALYLSGGESSSLGSSS